MVDFKKALVRLPYITPTIRISPNSLRTTTISIVKNYSFRRGEDTTTYGGRFNFDQQVDLFLNLLKNIKNDI